jgi:hypothetical protein
MSKMMFHSQIGSNWLVEKKTEKEDMRKNFHETIVHYSLGFIRLFVFYFSSMIKLNRSFGKRVSKFLSDMLWHFHQTTPTYSLNVHDRSSSVNKSMRNTQTRKLTNTEQRAMSSTGRQRTCVTRRRVSTLVSIEEENESDINNCK